MLGCGSGTKGEVGEGGGGESGCDGPDVEGRRTEGDDVRAGLGRAESDGEVDDGVGWDRSLDAGQEYDEPAATKAHEPVAGVEGPRREWFGEGNQDRPGEVPASRYGLWWVQS